MCLFFRTILSVPFRKHKNVNKTCARRVCLRVPDWPRASQFRTRQQRVAPSRPALAFVVVCRSFSSSFLVSSAALLASLAAPSLAFARPLLSATMRPCTLALLVLAASFASASAHAHHRHRRQPAPAPDFLQPREQDEGLVCSTYVVGYWVDYGQSYLFIDTSDLLLLFFQNRLNLPKPRRRLPTHRP